MTGSSRISFLAGLFLALAACSSSEATPPPAPADGGLALITVDGGLQLPFAPACSADDQCASGVCGIAGSGHCCAAACSVADPVCGASGCDFRGACEYPRSSSPCGAVCRDGLLTTSTCDGQGGCVAGSPAACPGNSGCALGGTACADTCIDDSNCAASAYCGSDGACHAKLATGGCQSDAVCSSGICGVAGNGACCAQRCPTADSLCGATGCDPNTGACIFGNRGASCGQSSCRAGEVSEGQCGASGSCDRQPATPCPGLFQCRPNDVSCLSYCVGSAECVAGSFCDAANGQCCLQSQAQTLFVDRDRGSDGPCCGRSPASGACLSLHRAMEIVADQKLAGVTIEAVASVSNCGPQTGNIGFIGCYAPPFLGPLGPFNTYSVGLWERPGVPAETYPIRLGWGVTLHAPALLFEGPTGQPYSTPVFLVQRYPDEPAQSLPVNIYGDLGGQIPMVVISHFNSVVDDTRDPNGQNLPMRLQGVLFDDKGSAGGVPGGPAAPVVALGPGAKVVLGPASVGLYKAARDPALDCNNCVVADDPAALGRVLSAGPDEATMNPNSGNAGEAAPLGAQPPGSQPFASPAGEIAVYGGGQVTLTQGPQLGFPGIANCMWDTAGIQVQDGTAVLGSPAYPASISCQYFAGALVVNPAGSLTLNSGTVAGNGCAGIYVNTGSVTANNILFQQNDIAVYADDNQYITFGSSPPVVRLRADTFSCQGFPDLQHNRNLGVQTRAQQYDNCLGWIVANLNPPVYGPFGFAAAVVDLAGTVDARQCQWDSYQGTSPQTWVCSDDSFSSCSCSGPNCPADGVGPVDGAGILTNGNALPLTAGGAQAASACTPN